MGPALCLLSAVAFGCMAIFGKSAYEAGVSVGALLLVRFALAAVVLGAVAHVRGVLRGLDRRAVVAGLAMGAVGYATQAGLFFLALERMDASLLSLLLYTFPVMVAGASIALGRERPSAFRLTALLVACAGTALVLAGAGTGKLEGVATVMALGAAVTYTTYILVGDRVGTGVPPLALSALVTTGATATFLVIALATGGPDLAFAAEGWLWLVLIGLVSTAGAVIAFFAGLALVGPTTAAILSTVEPVVTVALAAAVFGESLTPVQLAGGALVLGTVVALNAAALRQPTSRPPSSPRRVAISVTARPTKCATEAAMSSSRSST